MNVETMLRGIGAISDNVNSSDTREEAIKERDTIDAARRRQNWHEHPITQELLSYISEQISSLSDKIETSGTHMLESDMRETLVSLSIWLKVNRIVMTGKEK